MQVLLACCDAEGFPSCAYVRLQKAKIVRRSMTRSDHRVGICLCDHLVDRSRIGRHSWGMLVLTANVNDQRTGTRMTRKTGVHVRALPIRTAVVVSQGLPKVITVP